MKKLIALLTALVMVLTLTGCFGTTGGTSSADQANLPGVGSYTKDFDGLQKYITDRNSNAKKAEIFYEIVGADNGVRYTLSSVAFVEIYDFGSTFGSAATADSATPDAAAKDTDPEKLATAQAILADIKDDGKFRPIEEGTEMTAVITASGRYVIAWDATRSYKYDESVATEELQKNW